MSTNPVHCFVCMSSIGCLQMGSTKLKELGVRCSSSSSGLFSATSSFFQDSSSSSSSAENISSPTELHGCQDLCIFAFASSQRQHCPNSSKSKEMAVHLPTCTSQNGPFSEHIWNDLGAIDPVLTRTKEGQQSEDEDNLFFTHGEGTGFWSSSGASSRTSGERPLTLKCVQKHGKYFSSYYYL